MPSQIVCGGLEESENGCHSSQRQMVDREIVKVRSKTCQIVIIGKLGVVKLPCLHAVPFIFFLVFTEKNKKTNHMAIDDHKRILQSRKEMRKKKDILFVVL